MFFGQNDDRFFPLVKQISKSKGAQKKIAVVESRTKQKQNQFVLMPLHTDQDAHV